MHFLQNHDTICIIKRGHEFPTLEGVLSVVLCGCGKSRNQSCFFLASASTVPFYLSVDP